MKKEYWALLVFVLIIVLQWIGLGLSLIHISKCRKMSNYAKSDWQMTVTLHSSDSLFLYTSFCGVLVRHDKEKSYICLPVIGDQLRHVEPFDLPVDDAPGAADHHSVGAVGAA